MQIYKTKTEEPVEGMKIKNEKKITVQGQDPISTRSIKDQIQYQGSIIRYEWKYTGG
jgi:hypothetical protein